MAGALLFSCIFVKGFLDARARSDSQGKSMGSEELDWSLLHLLLVLTLQADSPPCRRQLQFFVLDFWFDPAA